MHIREIPHIIFDEFVEDPQEINEKEFARSQYPNLRDYELREDYNDITRIVGSTEKDFWLRLNDDATTHNIPTTTLSVFPNLVSAVIEKRPKTNVVAGNRDTGIWAAGRGNETEQTIWVETHKTYMDDLKRAAEFYEFLGKITQRAYEISSSNLFEHSRFFDGDIEY